MNERDRLLRKRAAPIRVSRVLQPEIPVGRERREPPVELDLRRLRALRAVVDHQRPRIVDSAPPGSRRRSDGTRPPSRGITTTAARAGTPSHSSASSSPASPRTGTRTRSSANRHPQSGRNRSGAGVPTASRTAPSPSPRPSVVAGNGATARSTVCRLTSNPLLLDQVLAHHRGLAVTLEEALLLHFSHASCSRACRRPPVGYTPSSRCRDVASSPCSYLLYPNSLAIRLSPRLSTRRCSITSTSSDFVGYLGVEPPWAEKTGRWNSRNRRSDGTSATTRRRAIPPPLTRIQKSKTLPPCTQPPHRIRPHHCLPVGRSRIPPPDSAGGRQTIAASPCPCPRSLRPDTNACEVIRTRFAARRRRSWRPV